MVYLELNIRPDSGLIPEFVFCFVPERVLHNAHDAQTSIIVILDPKCVRVQDRQGERVFKPRFIPCIRGRYFSAVASCFPIFASQRQNVKQKFGVFIGVLQLLQGCVLGKPLEQISVFFCVCHSTNLVPKLGYGHFLVAVKSEGQQFFMFHAGKGAVRREGIFCADGCVGGGGGRGVSLFSAVCQRTHDKQSGENE